MAHQEVYVSAPDHYHCERFMFGDRWRFGIECEVQGSEVDPWGSREPFGSFWFWVGGQVVGDPDIAEQLMHAFTPFYLPGSAAGMSPYQIDAPAGQTNALTGQARKPKRRAAAARQRICLAVDKDELGGF